jgi:hypothetical protein
MGKKIIITLFIIFWAVPILAEMVADTAWVRRYNGPGNSGDAARAMSADDSNHVYVTGESGYDYTTVKYNQNGDTVWVRSYSGQQNSWEGARAIAIDDSNFIYVTGASQSDYATIKYYPNGDTVWVRRLEGTWHMWDEVRAIIVDNLYNVYITGSLGGGNPTFSDYVTIKYYSHGDTAWIRRYSTPGIFSDIACDLVVDHFYNVYVTGYSFDDSDTLWDCVTIKYDSSGNQLWLKRYDGLGHGHDFAYNIAIDSADNVYIAGETFGRGSWGDYLTIKYRPNGDTAWVRTYNGPNNSYDRVLGMALDSSGHIYVTGYSARTSVDADYATIKYDSSGNELWVRRYNGPGNMDDIAFSIATDRSANVYITGCSYSNVPNLDYATIKYDSAGNELWVRKYNGPGNGIDEAHALVVDDFNNIYVTGWSYGSGTDMDYATLKYSEAMRGDTDRDGVIDLDDVVYLINYLYMNGYAPEPMEAGNTNCDGVVDVEDIVYLINYVLKGGPEPSCL